MNALILVDLQNDFMPGGALAVSGGHEVVPIANHLASLFPLVVATQDWHPINHQSFVTAHPGKQVGEQVMLGHTPQVLWPVHCVQDTAGAAFHADLSRGLIDRVFPKGTRPEIDSYSGFFDNDHRHDTGLAAYLQANRVQRVFIMGLATDYCVKATALDAQALGLATYVIEDGCRGVGLFPGDIQAALTDLQRAGVTITKSQAAISDLAHTTSA